MKTSDTLTTCLSRSYDVLLCHSQPQSTERPFPVIVTEDNPNFAAMVRSAVVSSCYALSEPVINGKAMYAWDSHAMRADTISLSLQLRRLSHMSIDLRQFFDGQCSQFLIDTRFVAYLSDRRLQITLNADCIS